MRVFCAGFGTESNTFAPVPTGLDAFYAREYYPAGEYPRDAIPSDFGSLIHVARKRAEYFGWSVQEGLVCSAPPGGRVTRRAYERFRDELLDDLKRAAPVNMVLLHMHGAMAADGYDDCEGDVLTRVRAIVGLDVVVGVELDPHCHVSTLMLELADVLVLYKEYPHTDILECAEELVDLCVAAHEARVQPVAALADCDMIVTMHTTREPGQGIVKRLRALEQEDDSILSASIVHGFPFGDVADMGTKVLVYADGNRDRADRVAQRLADQLISVRESLQIPLLSVDDALDEALQADSGPIVLADGADNPGSGAPGDSTFLLRAMLDRKLSNAALGPLWDPVAARIAFDAEPGATINLRLGGKIGPLSGLPVDAACIVRSVVPNLHMSSLTGSPVSMGDAALVDIHGIQVVVTSVRNQAMNTDLFTQLGCELAAKRLVVVKSAQHFYTSFSRVAQRVIYVAAEGVATPDFDRLEFSNIKRPKWPLSTA